MDCVGTNHITKSGSVGRLLPNLEARLVGENGDDVEVGQPGEIWVRGPIVMKVCHRCHTILEVALKS